jgi:hypothetical protein
VARNPTGMDEKNDATNNSFLCKNKSKADSLEPRNLMYR